MRVRARRSRLGLIAVLVLAPAVACAQSAATPTAQQAFDAAQALIDQRKFVEAEAAFAALETRLLASPKRPVRSLAVARLRRAQMLVTMGEDVRATALLLDAVTALGGPADGDLRREALVSLGEAEERSLDLSAAAVHYRAALTLVPPDDGHERVALGIAAARAGLFDDPAKVATELNSNLPEARRVLAKDRRALGQYMALYGRALLNAQQIKPARRALNEALDLSGGLTEKVHVADLAVRGDAALAAELDHDHAEAAHLIAYTGAGLGKAVSLRLPPDVDPPACGEDVAPSDMAVVQFSLGDDGHVSGAIPIYSARPGPNAVAFARAVAGWQWKPEDAKVIDPFFRLAARLELRCTTRADRLSAYDLVTPEVFAWLLAQDPGSARSSDSQQTPALRAALSRVERADAASKPLVPILVRLAARPDVDAVERRAMFDRALRIAEQAKAPAMVRAWLAIMRDHQMIVQQEHDYHAYWRRMAAGVRVRASDPAFADEPRARAWLLLIAAQHTADGDGLVEANAMLGDVLAMSVAGLAVDDPIRRAAAIRRASLQAALGQRDAAVATFAQSGVDPSQCALLDQTPIVASRQYSSADYPTAALRLGFEGWAVTEFDVTSDGKTQGARAIIVYPPFLFGPSAAGIVSRSRYRPTFRPDGALSCGGYRDQVRYVIPTR